MNIEIPKYLIYLETDKVSIFLPFSTIKSYVFKAYLQIIHIRPLR